MSENHIILATSKVADSPRRVISIEETVKGGVCRSCKETLDVGEPRIKVSYPNVIVQYAARVGAPAFFMHPKCFESNPVDFWRIGTAAYKETMSVAGFSLNPELDVIGWERFPEVHHCFSKCQEPLLAQQQMTSSTASLVSATKPVPNIPGVSAAVDKETDRHHTESIFKFSQIGELTDASSPELHQPKLESQIFAGTLSMCPQKRCATDSLDADNALKRVSAASINYCDTPAHEPADQNNQHHAIDRKSSRLTPQGCTQFEHCHVGMEDCLCTCHCRFSPEELQWATPGDAAKILGISVAILRSLAVARAIPVFIRPSGQRVYNIPSIRKFISEHTLQPMTV